MEFPRALAGESITDGDASGKVRGVIGRESFTRQEVDSPIKHAYAGVEQPVGVFDFEPVTFFIIFGGGELGDSRDSGEV